MLSRDDVIRMAHDAGIAYVTEVGISSATHEWLQRFAAAAYSAGVASKRVTMEEPDCRTCRLYVGNGSPCLTVAKCVDASQYKPSTPVQQWHGVA